jgi:hypothetical protein
MKRAVFGFLVLALGLVLAQAPKVDGKIAPGEYAKSFRHDKSGFTLYWSIVGDTIYLGLEGESKGWIGLGFLRREDGQEEGELTSTSSTWTGGSWWPWTCTRPSAPGPRSPDEKEGGKNSILAAAATYEGGRWTVEFSRKLKTGEPTDVEIVPGRKLILMLARWRTRWTPRRSTRRPSAGTWRTSPSRSGFRGPGFSQGLFFPWGFIPLTFIDAWVP